MKTTEIFVEQVIIGGLVMLIGYILFPQDVKNLSKCFNGTFAQISLGALMVGAAYLIGIVYDRFTDTLFQDLERHRRWNYILKGIESEEDLKNVLSRAESKANLYPENIYRMAVLKCESAAQREDYFRRRLRLTRAFATLIPGVSIAIVLNMSTSCTNEPWYKYKAALIPLAYLLAFLSKNTDCKLIRGNPPPKTNDIKKIKEYREKNKGNLKKLKMRLLGSILGDRSCQILFLVFMILAICHTKELEKIKYIIIMLIGTIFATIVTWSWWRIYQTYFSFIKDFYYVNAEKRNSI